MTANQKTGMEIADIKHQKYRQVILPNGSTADHADYTARVGEVSVNTDTNKLHIHDGVTPGGTVLQDLKAIQVACSDDTTDLTVGTGKLTFRMPYALRLTEVRASVTTAPTDAAIIVDVNQDGVSILSTKLSIDADEKTSTTAAAAAVISDESLEDDAEITIDIDQIGSTVAGAGLKVTLLGYQI